MNFSGRSRRSEYWYITLWTFILYILFFTGLFTALTGTAYTLSTNSVEDIWSGIWVGAGFMIIILIIFGLAVLLPSLASSSGVTAMREFLGGFFSSSTPSFYLPT
ncbi:DUF805 domain-containing protein [Lacticaseibacillus pantheris]|uniref:DUF805 domain-containing protein n=1 Tax=Lacticaseibacillus pantheris TaxID=171523 RepID=UPI0009EBF544|nr:DUF805 domain-containing protein [Lacticaseibacillus pantheris]